VFVVDSASRAPGVGTADQLRPPVFVYLMRMHDGQLALPSPSTQPVSGDIQVESTHHVVVLLAAAVVVDRGVLVGGLAELVPATTVRVMTTAATKPSLRTGHSYTTGAFRRAVGFGHQQHRPPVTFPNTCRQSQILAVGPPTRTRTSLSRYGVRHLASHSRSDLPAHLRGRLPVLPGAGANRVRRIRTSKTSRRLCGSLASV
jgi:hypothetical protein